MEEMDLLHFPSSLGAVDEVKELIKGDLDLVFGSFSVVYDLVFSIFRHCYSSFCLF